MTFLKKHAAKLFIIFLATVTFFLLWYHLFPIKIPFDHTLYSETGEEVTIIGEIQYYRSLSSKGGRAYGEVNFGGVKYANPSGGPNVFMLLNLEGKKPNTERDKIIITFTDDNYESFQVYENHYPSVDGTNYFLTKPDFYIETSNLAVKDKSKKRFHMNTNFGKKPIKAVITDGENYQIVTIP